MVRLMFETVVVTFGMFSALPMPRVDWTPRSMRWALACLPLVGFACGGALALWLAVCRLLNLSGLLPAAGICCAVGAMLAFCADRLTTLSELGGIRLRYGPVWVSAFTVLGWFLMILGAWLMAMPAV